MRILILGATGMLGSLAFRFFSESGFETWGTLRSAKGCNFFPETLHHRLITNIDVLNENDLIQVFVQVKPDLVINCVGVIKQLSAAKDPLSTIPINALFPHQLAQICALAGARMIHISTDCVFSGAEGNYAEDSLSDAEDLYGKSKYLGEVTDKSHVFTLRSSMIGHELNSNLSLVDWFLSQEKEVKGYQRAIYSGLPTIELVRVMRDIIIPKPQLFGLYHVVAKPITKYDLLQLIAEQYNKKITITPDESVQIDRSLNGSRFITETGYQVSEWSQLIEQMYQSKKLVGVV